MSDNWKIPLYKIFSDDEDINLITKIIKRGNQWAIGPEIEELEKRLADYVGVDYCVAVNSGTSALHSSLLAYMALVYRRLAVGHPRSRACIPPGR